jgi:hypothetical protein
MIERLVNSEIIKFCRENPDNWRDLLSKDPYNLIIKEEDCLVLFKYNQILSDFSLPICREARGFITSIKFNSVYCRSFAKFFNYGEKYAAEIDWQSARVEDKIDGSLIRIWWNPMKNGWQVSTSGTIDAFNAKISDGERSFGDLVMEALNKILGEDVHLILPKNMTHVFELVSPESRVVVPYKETDLYYLTSFYNDSGEEVRLLMTQFNKPKSYPLVSLEDCIQACSKMDISQEGFVVFDKDFNRIKIKSPAYLAAHRIGNNGAITPTRIVDLIRTNIVDDFIGIFPEYTKKIDIIRENIKKYVIGLVKWVNVFTKFGLRSLPRKDFAREILISDPKFRTLIFMWYDEKFSIDNAEEFCYNWLMSRTDDKILEMIGEKKNG